MSPPPAPPTSNQDSDYIYINIYTSKTYRDNERTYILHVRTSHIHKSYTHMYIHTHTQKITLALSFKTNNTTYISNVNRLISSQPYYMVEATTNYAPFTVNEIIMLLPQNVSLTPAPYHHPSRLKPRYRNPIETKGTYILHVRIVGLYGLFITLCIP